MDLHPPSKTVHDRFRCYRFERQNRLLPRPHQRKGILDRIERVASDAGSFLARRPVETKRSIPGLRCPSSNAWKGPFPTDLTSERILGARPINFGGGRREGDIPFHPTTIHRVPHEPIHRIEKVIRKISFQLLP